jgi:hypothetical protein
MTHDKLDDRAVVRSLLQMAGIEPDLEEIDAMAEAYPASRRSAAALYAVPGIRYEDPALTFDPLV